MPYEVIALAAEIDGHEVSAEVSVMGASIQSLIVDGLSIVRGSSSGRPAMASGVVLVPWPNRVRNAQWTLDGEAHQLDISEEPAGNAIHGLLADAPYTVALAEADRVVLTAGIRHPHGYPFDLNVTVEYALVADGIRVSMGIHNSGNRTAPVALGAHPYLRVGDTVSDELTLSIDAERTLLLGRDDLPVSMVDVAGTLFDLRREVGVRQAPRHASFTGLNSSDGRARLQLHAANARVEVWADHRFRWAQLYLTEDFPGLDAGELAVALEPMTAPPDALNSGIDLHRLEPGARWSREWGISLVR